MIGLCGALADIPNRARPLPYGSLPPTGRPPEIAHNELVDTVLFLCYNNAGRSQMAEAFFNARAAERGIDAHAESAGLLGVGAMHPLVVRCVEELGVSMEGIKPKQVTKEMLERAQTIVTFGHVTSAHTALKFEVSEDWPAEDSAGLAYGRLCEVRDEISRNVDDLLNRLATRS